jgi:hypothetical protein|tara:strand:- start:145 stop:384 length:240 start_codon:yes stop_codon:yes gene_type:complete
MDKKSQGLSINVIVLAVIGLVVLIISIAIFSNETSKSVNLLESCDARGGLCVPSDEVCSGITIPIIECGLGNKCCVTLD